MQLDQIGSIDQYKYWNEKLVTYWLKYDNEINRKFITEYGSYEDLCEKAGLTSENIKKNALKILKK